MNFNILSVRSADDEPTTWYPTLDHALAPIFEPTDGVDPITLPVSGLSVLIPINGQLQRVLGSTTDLDGLLWITNQRIIVRCKNYDKVTWNRQNTANTIFFGLGTEVAFHTASKLYRRAKSARKAFVGHLHYPWIRSVQYQMEEGKKFPPAVRFRMTKRLQNQTGQDMYLQLVLKGGTDSSDVARQIIQRCLAWWDVDQAGLAPEVRTRVQALQVMDLPVPDTGMMATVDFPVFRLTNTDKVYP